MNRKLEIDENVVLLHNVDAEAMLDIGMLYECGHGHDLHLTPDYDWAVEDVEILVKSISLAQGAGR